MRVVASVRARLSPLTPALSPKGAREKQPPSPAFDIAREPSMTRPLDGITVVSLEHAVAAPFATRQLAELGWSAGQIDALQAPQVD
ncbi:hypothetical protein ALDI51_01790 [Alicycliphilus denitrificans]|nr:hypothetical protein ALDI51_01790 [Alicycliphilus denitrificans]